MAGLYSTLTTSVDACGKVLAEYVWMGTTGCLRSKTRVLDQVPQDLESLPVIVVPVDEEAAAHSPASGDVILKPRRTFRDPFRQGQHLVVLCDVLETPTVDFSAAPSCPTLQPHPSNMRMACESVMQRVGAEAPMFAVEQEYCVQQDLQPEPCTMAESSCSWPHAHLPDPTKPQFYGPQGEVTQTIPAVGGTMLARAAAARKLSEAHLHCCLHAGLKMTSCGESSQPGIWSYKLGPLSGTDLGDQLWMSRHMLLRLAESMGVPVSFDPGATRHSHRLSCSFKFSTASSRSPDIGLSIIQQYLGKLQASHVQHLVAYGLSPRPDIGHTHAPITCAIGGTAAHLVIPTTTALRRCGHIQDRRPASNADPWVISMLLAASVLGIPIPSTDAATSATTTTTATCVAAPASCFPGSTQQAALMDALLQAMAARVPAAAAAAAAAPSPACPASSGMSNASLEGGACSWGCGSDTTSASLCTEDLLVQELDRMDGYVSGPRPDDHMMYGDCYEGSCCSDGTSPERDQEQDDACSGGPASVHHPLNLTLPLPAPCSPSHPSSHHDNKSSQHVCSLPDHEQQHHTTTFSCAARAGAAYYHGAAAPVMIV